MTIEVKIIGETVEELATQAVQFSGPFAAYMVAAQQQAAVQQAAVKTNGAAAPVVVDTPPVPEDIFPPSDDVGVEPVDYDYETHVKPRASAVVKKIGMEATKQLLQKEFGVKRPIDLKPEHFAGFMSQTEKFV